MYIFPQPSTFNLCLYKVRFFERAYNYILLLYSVWYSLPLNWTSTSHLTNIMLFLHILNLYLLWSPWYIVIILLWTLYYLSKGLKMKRNSSLNLPIPLLSCFLPLPKSKFLFGIILLLHVEFLLTSPKVQVYKWLIPVLLVSNNLNFSWTFEHSIPGKRIVGRHFVFCLFVFLVL